MTASISVALTNKHGLHARPAHLFVQTANGFQSEIRVGREGLDMVNGKSIMGIMMLAAEHGSTLQIEADGDDADAALAALKDLVERGFDEE